MPDTRIPVSGFGLFQELPTHCFQGHFVPLVSSPVAILSGHPLPDCHLQAFALHSPVPATQWTWLGTLLLIPTPHITLVENICQRILPFKG